MERRLAVTVGEARIAPLRAVGTATLTIPAVVPDTGRLRVLAAGVATPGGAGPALGRTLGWTGSGRAGGVAVGSRRFGWTGRARMPPGSRLAPPCAGDVAAARRLRQLLAAGIPGLGAVLAGSDEGVLIANRLGVPVPVIDQVDVAWGAACTLLAIEVRPLGQPLTLLTDPVALSAALRLGGGEGGDAATEAARCSTTATG